MNRYIQILALLFCLAFVQLQASENKPYYIFNETTPGKGNLILPELNIGGTTSYLNVNIELDFNDGSFMLKRADAANANYYTPPVETVNGGRRVTGSWLSSGGQNRFSFRNHHYQFDVTQSGNVGISIESSTNNYLYLVNSLGFIVSQTYSNSFTNNLSPDTYTVIAATYDAAQQSNYMLSIIGPIDNIRRINSRRVEQIGNWVSSGGQLSDSYRNKHYLFDVAVDSYMDITIQSNVSNYFYLINSLGFVIAKTYNNRFTANVSAGSYRLVVATYDSNQTSNYLLTIVGQFSNLREKLSNTVERIDSWSSSGGQDRYSVNNPSYTLNVTEASLLDITIASSVDNYLYLVDSLDNVVAQTYNDRLTALVPVGQYKIVAATYYAYQASNFVLNVNGQFDRLLKN